MVEQDANTYTRFARLKFVADIILFIIVSISYSRFTRVQNKIEYDAVAYIHADECVKKKIVKEFRSSLILFGVSNAAVVGMIEPRILFYFSFH